MNQIPNKVERDQGGHAQGITPTCEICGWQSSGHFSSLGASAAKMEHKEKAHTKP